MITLLITDSNFNKYDKNQLIIKIQKKRRLNMPLEKYITVRTRYLINYSSFSKNQNIDK